MREWRGEKKLDKEKKTEDYPVTVIPGWANLQQENQQQRRPSQSSPNSSGNQQQPSVTKRTIKNFIYHVYYY